MLHNSTNYSFLTLAGIAFSVICAEFNYTLHSKLLSRENNNLIFHAAMTAELSPLYVEFINYRLISDFAKEETKVYFVQILKFIKINV